MRLQRGRIPEVGFLVITLALLAIWPTHWLVSPVKEARAAEPDAEFQAKWKALMKAAKDEGKMVSVTTGRGGLEMAPILRTFSKKFGIKVVVGRGSGREHHLAGLPGDHYRVDPYPGMAHAGHGSSRGRRSSANHSRLHYSYYRPCGAALRHHIGRTTQLGRLDSN